MSEARTRNEAAGKRQIIEEEQDVAFRASLAADVAKEAEESER